MSKISKWNDSYISFGFTKVTRNGRNCAQYLYYSVVMSNASLRPSKLKSIKSIPKGRMMTSMLCLPKSTIRPGSDAIYLGFTVEENLLFNAAMRWHIKLRSVRSRILLLRNLSSHAQKKMVEIVFGSGAKKKIQQVSLSNDTIHLRIDDRAANVCQQVCFKIKQNTTTLAFNWTSLPIAPEKATSLPSPVTRKIGK